MKKKTTMKVSRGRLEEERRKSEDRYEYQKVMLIILPVIMIAVLVVGIYFGYLSYSKTHLQPGNTTDTTTVTKESSRTDDQNDYILTVVNSAQPVDKSFVPQLSDYQGVMVSSLMIDDLSKMLADASAQGINISVDSGYISFEEQKVLYDTAVSEHKKKNESSTVKAEAAVKKTIPAAGQSEQQTGLVVRLSDSTDADFQTTAQYHWLMKNSVNYGFVLRYPDDENTGGLSFAPDLYRYVGVENAVLMRAYDMTLDEYVQYLGS